MPWVRLEKLLCRATEERTPFHTLAHAIFFYGSFREHEVRPLKTIGSRELQSL